MDTQYTSPATPRAENAPGWQSFAQAVFATLSTSSRDYMFPDRADLSGQAPTAQAKDHLSWLDTLDEDAEEDVWRRPRALPLLTLLQLCRTFETPERLWEAFAADDPTRADLTVIATGSDPSAEALAELLCDHVLKLADYKRGAGVEILGPDDLAEKPKKPDSTALFAELGNRLRRALQTAVPVVCVVPSSIALPDLLRRRAARHFQLAPLDEAILRLFLKMTFPDKAGEVDNLPSDKMLAAVSLEDFVLSCRAQTPEGVVAALIKSAQASCAAGVTFRDFPLPDNVRAPLEAMLTDLQAWKSGQLAWGEVSRGFLISGPPGSGKTEIARALSRDAGVDVVSGSIAQWQANSDRSGAFMQNMQKFFTTAATKAPCIAFIDELDAVGDRMRAPDHNSAYTDMVVTGLLECMDGFEQREGVCFIGATNQVDKIDAAIRRPGRFDKILALGYPDPDLMPRVIRFHLKDLLPDADLALLAARAAGLSGAEIAAFVRDAKGQARAQQRNLAFGDLEGALSRVRPQLPAGLMRRIAVHEAAHAVVAMALRTGRVTMVQLLESGGLMTQELSPRAGTRAELEALICVGLAGRAAEREVIGSLSGGAGDDANSDLAQATRHALKIERTSGLGDASEFWYESPEQTQFTLSRDRDLQRRVQQHLTVADVRATEILQANHHILEQLAAKLEQQSLVTGAELSGLLAGVKIGGIGQDGPV